MDKEIKLLNREEADRQDIEYWKSKTSSEKLNVLQQLREQHIRLFNLQKKYDEARKRLRRFYRIIKQT